MNNLISMIFGDEYISLACRSGECLYKEDVPGYVAPIKEINTPVLAAVASSVALLILAIILVSWYSLEEQHTRNGAQFDLERDLKMMPPRPW